MANTSTRTALIDGKEIIYQFERKPVKNLNLRIRRDGSVYASANKRVPLEQVDAFVLSKGRYILSAIKHFEELAQRRPHPKEYVDGEIFSILGRELRLKVSEGPKDTIRTDGACIHLQVKNNEDALKKQRMVAGFLDRQCKQVFGEVIAQTYPLFQKYGVALPALRIRNMTSRWGSCLVGKGIITLNKRLLEAPRTCIEYVVMHEFCHFIHPNHAKAFYHLLATLMPDWKERKNALNQSAAR